jgi:hypothetical protein
VPQYDPREGRALDRRVLGWALAGAGVVFVSAFADRLGLGTRDGFGWRQAAGIAGGVVIAVVGVLMARRAGASDTSTGS